ncbi:MAG TPA: CBS domain-containing protein [Vicinamibacterales bacterium]|nr:CBS domain-containing protein [Vicinamibacterales bacterium]
MIYFTELDHLPAFDVKGVFLGQLVDLGINPIRNSSRVEEYLIETPGRERLVIPHVQMQAISNRALQAGQVAREVLGTPNDALIRVKKDVLDQQIIDVNSRKVVRVTDVVFEIEPSERHSHLRLVAVDVGAAAGVRRLLQGLLAKHRIRVVSGIFQARVIPWEFVNLIEPDPARRLRLRISYDRLAALHPADLADILEELSPDEQRAVIESLDDETAAHALAEVPDKVRMALLEQFPADKAADLIEEMPPDEAADALQSLAPAKSAEVLAGMEREEAQEMRGLLGFDAKTAGGMMTTECVIVRPEATVADGVEALRAFEGDLDEVDRLFLTDAEGILRGMVRLARLLLARPEEALESLATPPVATVPAHADIRTVLGLFYKYSLLVLPVTDDHDRLLGVITADDAIEHTQ